MSKLFDGKSHRFCLDQYGQHIWAKTRKDLIEQCGCRNATKQYVDKVAGPHAGKTMWNGYVVGHRWFTVFAPVEIEM
jgi:hypothetical protein